MNILITGGNGFIGSHIVRRLVKLNHSVVLVLRKNSNTGNIKDVLRNIKIYEFVDFAKLDDIFLHNSIDVIIHLAGKYVKSNPTPDEVKEMTDVNLAKSSLLVNSAVKFGVKGFINTGTFFEYKVSGKPLTEKTTRVPLDYYAATKVGFEEMLKYFSSREDLSSITLRLFSPYGPMQEEKVIPLILKSAIVNKSLKLTNGKQKLSFTYIDDIVDAYVKSLEYIFSSDYKGYQDFNIGSKESYSVRDIIRFVEKLSKKNISVDLGVVPYEKNEFMNVVCNSSKAKRMLGWVARTDIKNGLSMTLKFIMSQQV